VHDLWNILEGREKKCTFLVPKSEGRDQLGRPRFRRRIILRRILSNKIGDSGMD
jgi:hypothetical protein